MNLNLIVGNNTVMENFYSGGVKQFRIMLLSSDDERLVLPVTPWKFSVSTEQNNKIVDILDFGENLIFGNSELKKLKVSCFLPKMSHEYSFVVGDNKDPEECIDAIINWKESKKPVRVIITDSVVNWAMAIMSFDFKERDGSRDVYYELNFTESKEFNIPNANYIKTVDEGTGLKGRASDLSSILQSSLVKSGVDILEKSKFATGIFSGISSFKSSNGLARNALSAVSSFAKSWSW